MKRRLIGPTFITVIASALWIDFVFFRYLPWSASNLISKVVVILAKIFIPLLDPALNAWIGEIIVPVIMILLAIILLHVSVSRAKVAMGKATPNADASAPLTAPTSVSWTAPIAAPVPELEAAAEPITSRKMVNKPFRFGLTVKLTVSFGIVGLLFGVSACVIVYSFVYRGIETEMKSRADVLAFSINEKARHQSAFDGVKGLRADVEEYASNGAVAYVYVEDGEGIIVANTPKDFPIYLKREFPKSAERALKGIFVQYRGLDVYEITKRIGDGKSGFVHLAIWRGVIEDEARRAVTPIAASIFAVLLTAAGIFFYIARYVNRSFVELVEHAERISKGEFAVPLKITRSDEIGDIARSLERMRSSLRAVLTRLEADELTK